MIAVKKFFVIMIIEQILFLRILAFIIISINQKYSGAFYLIIYAKFSASLLFNFKLCLLELEGFILIELYFCKFVTKYPKVTTINCSNVNFI